jgi:hypothetical protein
MAYAGRQAFGLLHSCLLDEGLHLTALVVCLGHRWFRHHPEQRRCCDELLAYSQRSVRVIDIEVGIDALAGLPAQLARMFATRRGFSRDGGTQEPHLPVLFRELGLELSRLG